MKSVKFSFHSIVSTGFGSGFAPIAPGTAGSALACIIYWFALKNLPDFAFAITAVTFAALAIWTSDKTAKELNQSDPKIIVADEFAGMFFTLAFQPNKSLTAIIVAFFLFRFFDILKPFPIRQSEKKFKGGLGIVMDDLLAGVFANVCTRLVLFGMSKFWTI